MLWLVLLACLRAVSLSQAQLPWQTSLAALAVIRLLTAMPITPGGLGVTELGLIGILAGGAGHKAGAQVTAAVLMYRAVTYVPCIPLGALACLTWRYAPALIGTSLRSRPPRSRGLRRLPHQWDRWNPAYGWRTSTARIGHRSTRSSATSGTPSNPAGRSLSSPARQHRRRHLHDPSGSQHDRRPGTEDG